LVCLLVAAGAGAVWQRATAMTLGDAFPAGQVAVIRDHLLLGTGLASAPLVFSGSPTHGTLTLAVETGFAGVALAILFALAIARAARQRRGGPVPPPPGPPPPAPPPAAPAGCRRAPPRPRPPARAPR